MQSLHEFFLENNARDIDALARYVEKHIRENWQSLFETNQEKLLDAYNRIGDMAYGVYCNLLFRPVHEQLKLEGLRAKPRLPGGFSLSREWGPEDARQRWFWSAIHPADGAALGTLVTVFFHDHYQVRVPQQPQVFALTETSQGAVVRALSERSPDFKEAVEAKVEIAESMKSLQSQGGHL